jgi:hypothetical protein
MNETVRHSSEVVLSYVNKQDCKFCTPLCNTQTLPRWALLSKCHTVSWYMHKYYFIYTHKKSTAFLAHQCREGHTYEFHENHFMKRITAQQHYVQILHTKFLPNQTLHLESTNRNSLMPLSKIWLPLHQFSQNAHSINSVGRSCTELYLNWIQTVGKMRKISFMLLTKERLSMHKFSRNLWFLNSNVWKSSTEFHPNW